MVTVKRPFLSRFKLWSNFDRPQSITITVKFDRDRSNFKKLNGTDRNLWRGFKPNLTDDSFFVQTISIGKTKRNLLCFHNLFYLSDMDEYLKQCHNTRLVECFYRKVLLKLSTYNSMGMGFDWWHNFVCVVIHFPRGSFHNHRVNTYFMTILKASFKKYFCF